MKFKKLDTRMFDAFHHYTPVENVAGIMQNGLGNGSFTTSVFRADDDQMAKDLNNFTTMQNNIEKRKARMQRNSDKISNQNRNIREKSVDELGLRDHGIESQVDYRWAAYHPDEFIQRHPELKGDPRLNPQAFEKWDESITAKEIPDKKLYNSINSFYDDDRYPMAYRQMNLLDGRGGTNQGMRKMPSQVRIVGDYNGDLTDKDISKYVNEYPGERRIVTTGDEYKGKFNNLKVQLPFGSVTKDNYKDYLDLMKNNSKYLDMNDTYTRRIYNIYNKRMNELRNAQIEAMNKYPNADENFINDKAHKAVGW